MSPSSGEATRAGINVHRRQRKQKKGIEAVRKFLKCGVNMSTHQRTPMHHTLRRRLAVGMAAGVLLAGGVWLYSATHSRPAKRPVDFGAGLLPTEKDSPRLKPESVKIADGIFLLGELFPAAAYVVETSEGLVLIDSGVEADYGKLRQGLSQLGLEFGRLKLILLTHVHGDHSMGASRLRRETGAKIYIGREDARPLREGGPPEAIFSKFEMDSSETHPTEIDGELIDGDVLSLGEATFSCIATPGHTHGSFCFLLRLGETTALFTGDTLMTLNDGLGTYSACLPPRYRGDALAYLASLRKLSRLSPPELVLPGHPRHDPTPQDPRFPPEQWHEFVVRGVAELERLVARHASDGADFLDGTPKQLAPGLFYLGDFDGRAAYAVVSESRSLLFDPPGGDIASELLDQVWRRLGVPAPRVAAVLLTSCRSPNASGLRTVVMNMGCPVVASAEGIMEVSRLCPDGTTVIAADDLSELEWDSVESISLKGQDETAVGYTFRCDGALVLVTGDYPVEGGFGEMARLKDALSRPENDWDAWRSSLRRLERIRPDIWLSARPLHGRNANLYDDDWELVLGLNAKLLQRARGSHLNIDSR